MDFGGEVGEVGCGDLWCGRGDGGGWDGGRERGGKGGGRFLWLLLGWVVVVLGGGCDECGGLNGGEIGGIRGGEGGKERGRGKQGEGEALLRGPFLRLWLV